MVDDITEPQGNNFYTFFTLLGVFLLCLFYCCRHEDPADDPANDPIAGYIPNPRQQTASLEERRKSIEDSLITRKVIEETLETTTNNNSSRSTTSFMKRISNSDRTFSSYAMAFGGFNNSSRKISFSSRNLRHSTSLPLSFNDKKPNDDVQGLKSQSVREFTDEEEHQMIEESKIVEEVKEEDELSNKGGGDLEIPNGGDKESEDKPEEKQSTTIKHRRKADIIARTLSRAIRGPQDYDMPTTCDICLMEYEVGEDVAWSNNDACVHAFHKECIVDWLLRNPKCPLCRNDYVVTVDNPASEE